MPTFIYTPCTISCIVLTNIRCTFRGIHHELYHTVSADSCQMFCCISYIRPHTILANMFVEQHTKPNVYIYISNIGHINYYIIYYTNCYLWQIGHVSCTIWYIMLSHMCKYIYIYIYRYIYILLYMYKYISYAGSYTMLADVYYIHLYRKRERQIRPHIYHILYHILYYLMCLLH